MVRQCYELNYVPSKDVKTEPLCTCVCDLIWRQCLWPVDQEVFESEGTLLVMQTDCIKKEIQTQRQTQTGRRMPGEYKDRDQHDI